MNKSRPMAMTIWLIQVPWTQKIAAPCQMEKSVSKESVVALAALVIIIWTED